MTLANGSGQTMNFAPIMKSLPLIMAGALAACASTPRLGGDPQLSVYNGSELPAPAPVDLTAQARAYFVGPYDKLKVDVFGIPELSGRDVQVDEAGRIFFPPAGSINVSGKTLNEVGQELALQLRANHVRDPQVSVTLTQAVSQVVTITGEVKTPGNFPVFGRMSLMRAMSLSGGLSEFAKQDDVVIFRTVGGHRYAALYNLKAISHGQHPDPEVYANDIVMVGDSPGRRLFKDMATIIPLVTTPILVIDNLTR